MFKQKPTSSPHHSTPTGLIMVVLAALAGAALAACSPVRSYHGYVPERGESPEAAEAGVDTKQTVLAKFGEPSTLGAFNENTWYYLSSRRQRYAFQRDHTIWRKVVAVKFGDDNIVAEVNTYTLEDGRKIAHVNRVTPTRGKELSLMEQIFGNIGRLPADTGQQQQ